jgi:DNA uptake protein ComE-like DNA-binding protein
MSRRPATIRRTSPKVTASMTERQDEGAGPGAEGRPSSPPSERPANPEPESTKRAVDAARREAEEKATAEILALEEHFEREREHTAKALEELQRRLEEAEARAGNVSITDAREDEERERLQREAGRQLDDEMRRLQSESDAKIEEALAKVESDTRARIEREAERRLTEREEELRAEADERIRAAGETAREQAERQFRDELESLRGQLEEERGSRRQLIEKAEARAEKAEASVKDVETARLDAEAEARSAAAEWIRGQMRSVRAEVPEAKGDTVEQEPAEAAEPKLGFLRRRAEAESAEAPEQGPAEAKPAREKAKLRRRTGPLDVNKASFEQFRELGMSVTEATRVIAYRERLDGFKSVDDLDSVPGLSKKLIQIRDRLTA